MGLTGAELWWLVILGCGFLVLLVIALCEEAGARILLLGLAVLCVLGMAYHFTGSLYGAQWIVATWEGGAFGWLIGKHKQRIVRNRQEQERREREEEERIRAGCALRLEEEKREQRQRIRTERRLQEQRNRADRREKQQEVQKNLPPHRPSGGSGLKAVAGMASLKKLLKEEVVDVFRNPAKFQKYGITIPNGILLFGPPGCGKTYIARQLASELKYHFFEVSPSDISDTYVHGTTLKIRQLFEEAARKAPSVLFIDEFEALVPDRAAMVGHQHKAEEVNEFLARMATCSERGVLLIAATNAPSKVDPAVRRSGRIDKKIYVGPPDQVARREILAHHMRGRYVSAHLPIDVVAETLGGYSSSDLKLLVDEAAKLAMKSNEAIGEKHLNLARMSVTPSISREDEAQYEQYGAGGETPARAMQKVGFRPNV